MNDESVFAKVLNEFLVFRVLHSGLADICTSTAAAVMILKYHADINLLFAELAVSSDLSPARIIILIVK